MFKILGIPPHLKLKITPNSDINRYEFQDYLEKIKNVEHRKFFVKGQLKRRDKLTSIARF